MPRKVFETTSHTFERRKPIMSDSVLEQLAAMTSRDATIDVSHSAAEQPKKAVVDILGDEFADVIAPNQPLADHVMSDVDGIPVVKAGSQPLGSEPRPLPQPPAAEQPQPQTDPEYDAAFEQLVQERVRINRAVKVGQGIVQEFMTKHHEYVANPANSALIGETLTSHGLPLTLEALEQAYEATKFMMDNRPAKEFSQADIERSNAVPWPMPPDELIEKAAPARAQQPRPQQHQQPSQHPPCAECGASYEQHVNGECPRVQPQNWSSGLPERADPVVQSLPSISDAADLGRIRQEMDGMSIEQARAYFMRLAAANRGR
jgi:hypothetical protein